MGKSKLFFSFMEVIKVIYILIYSVTYAIATFLIKKRAVNTVIIAKHSNNAKNYIHEKAEETYILISDNKNMQNFCKKDKNCTQIIDLCLLSTLSQIIAIIKADKIVIDDYYGPLYLIDNRKKIINIWHSYAIYKKIGLDAPLYSKRKSLSIKRFYKNYQRLDVIFVRSELEKEIFANSFKVNQEKMEINACYYETTLPAEINNKKRDKVVLYAPTHRPYDYDYNKIYHFLVKKFSHHKVIPIYHQITLKESPDKLLGIDATKTIDSIIKTAEIMVTDYSSLLIEVYELAKEVDVYQIIDEADFDKYNEIQGLNSKYYPQMHKKIYFKS
ncbi:MAG: CDP-glycerol glycerophosphotransferase family protein [Culicoidibacterales bacterium]